MSDNLYLEVLKSGLQQMHVDVTPHVEVQLLAYVELLAKWSKVYNLTTIREPRQIVVQHLLDSLVLLPYVSTDAHILDVGTGAGLPGIPLAITRNDLVVKLIDSQQKKINFVQHVITSLQLLNAEALHARVESLSVNFRACTIVSRAFASLGDFVKSIANLCDTSTKVIAMKGRIDRVMEESRELPADFTMVRVEKVLVPGLDAERCVVFLQKTKGIAVSG